MKASNKTMMMALFAVTLSAEAAPVGVTTSGGGVYSVTCDDAGQAEDVGVTTVTLGSYDKRFDANLSPEDDETIWSVKAWVTVLEGGALLVSVRRDGELIFSGTADSSGGFSEIMSDPMLINDQYTPYLVGAVAYAISSEYGTSAANAIRAALIAATDC